MGGFDDGHATGLQSCHPPVSRDGKRLRAAIRPGQAKPTTPSATRLLHRQDHHHRRALRGGLDGLWLLGRSWYQLLIAAFPAVAFTQVAFLGHNAGHRQIFASRRASDLLGFLHGNLLAGLSFGWWVDTHSRHRAHPNTTEGADPDVGAGALISPARKHKSARRRLPGY